MFGLVQQLVAPLDRRAQRLLARVDTAAGLEQIQPLREPLDELRGREDSDPRRRQLERERDAIEPAADVDDGRCGVSIQAKRLIPRARAIDEEPDRFDPSKRAEIYLGVKVRQRQRYRRSTPLSA